MLVNEKNAPLKIEDSLKTLTLQSVAELILKALRQYPKHITSPLSELIRNLLCP